MLENRLLALLRCPKSGADLVFDSGFLISVDSATRLCYRFEGNVPILFISESERLAESSWQAAMERCGVRDTRH